MRLHLDREGLEVSDSELRQLAKDREYEEAWESDEVQSWLASLSLDDRAIVKAAHCDQASVSHAGLTIKPIEEGEKAQQRIDSITAAEGHEHSIEDEFAYRFEDDARTRGIGHIDPAIMGAALAAFETCTLREHGAIAEAKRSTAIKIVQLLARSSSLELAFRAECLLVVEGMHGESMAEIGRRYLDPRTGKSMSRANVSKTCRELERGLKLGIRKSLKKDDYVAACRNRTQAHHDRHRDDAMTNANTNTPCKNQTRILSLSQRLQLRQTQQSQQQLIA